MKPPRLSLSPISLCAYMLLLCSTQAHYALAVKPNKPPKCNPSVDTSTANLNPTGNGNASSTNEPATKAVKAN